MKRIILILFAAFITTTAVAERGVIISLPLKLGKYIPKYISSHYSDCEKEGLWLQYYPCYDEELLWEQLYMVRLRNGDGCRTELYFSKESKIVMTYRQAGYDDLPEAARQCILERVQELDCDEFEVEVELKTWNNRKWARRIGYYVAESFRSCARLVRVELSDPVAYEVCVSYYWGRSSRSGWFVFDSKGRPIIDGDN